MDTKGIEYETWHDQRPSHPAISPLVKSAQAAYDMAIATYDKYIDYIYSGSYHGEIDYERINILADDVLTSERALQYAKRCQWADEDETDYRDTCNTVRPGGA